MGRLRSSRVTWLTRSVRQRLALNSLNRALRKAPDSGTGVGKGLLQRRQRPVRSWTDASQSDAGRVPVTLARGAQEPNQRRNRGWRGCTRRGNGLRRQLSHSAVGILECPDQGGRARCDDEAWPPTVIPVITGCRKKESDVPSYLHIG